MTRIRVLVVDDAAVVRKIVTDALASDPRLEVVGTAANGKLALTKIEQLNPDVVTLDIEMPEMDGLEALTEIRKTRPRLPVIMFSTLTERGAAATLDALSLGASDYVTKPSNVGSILAAQQKVRDELIPKIHGLCWRVAGTLPSARPRVSRASTLAASAIRTPRPARAVSKRIDVVAIGVSTGGPNALTQLFQQLPKDLPVPIVIVQHMPPVFTKLLADRLHASSNVTVEEGTPGRRLQSGHAYIAPGDYHMMVRREGGLLRLATDQAPAENSCRPAVDVLFKSAAAATDGHLLAVVLTGMGQDGLRGAESVVDAGGDVFVQDQASSVVWGMPGAIAGAGLADRIVPLANMATAIVQRLQIRSATVSATCPPGLTVGH